MGHAPVRAGVLACALGALIGCSHGPSEAGPIDRATAALTLRGDRGLAKLDRPLRAAFVKWASAKRNSRWRGLANLHRTMPKRLLRLRAGRSQGRDVAMVDVFIRTDPASLPALASLGAHVRTLTSSGVATASVPMERLMAVAELASVTRVESATRVKQYMDISRGPTGVNIPASFTPAGELPTGGAGVVVGILDGGLDWDHADFRDETGATRVHALWDQSDYSDLQPPNASKNYGYVYEAAQIQACIDGVAGTYCAQEDLGMHGTHVTGTAAANGRAYGLGSALGQFAGVAPEATLIVAKFDFGGPRNNATGIIDGVDWIFERAAALGLPAVVNLSLGNDFGPHDGSTLQELGLDDLTGPGRIIVAAAGNAARVDHPHNLWGPPMHGSGAVPTGGCSEIELDVAAAGAGDSVWFSLWYPGSDSNYIRVITPSGRTYPNRWGQWLGTWDTGTPTTYYRSSEGTIVVGNGGDVLNWGATQGDNELYVELSDFDNANPVAVGLWRVRICDDGMAGTQSAYDAWVARSVPMHSTQVSFDGQSTDNVMTVGNPGSAHKVIAAGAYTTRMCWQYADLDDTNGLCVNSPESPCCQCYNDYPAGPQSGMAPFFEDTNGDGLFSYDFSQGGHACYLDDPADSSEPYDEQVAHFSSRGPTRDGRIKPDVVAPGVGIVSSLSQEALALTMTFAPYQTWVRWTNVVTADQLHTTYMGTSMASPHVAGATALMLAVDPQLDPEAVRSLLQLTARDDSAGTTPNNDWGGGKIDVAAALAELIPSPECLTHDDCSAAEGNLCVDYEKCIDGVCTPVSLECGPSDACSLVSCDPNLGCVQSPMPCDDGNACTDDSCDPALGCVFTNNTDPCDDGDACTTGDVCFAGSCQGNTPVTCNDSNPCTDDSCDTVAGCTYSAEPEGTACPDGTCNTASECVPDTPVCDVQDSVSSSDRNDYFQLGILAAGTVVSAQLGCEPDQSNVDLYLQRCRTNSDPCTSWRTRRSSRGPTCSEALTHTVTRFAGRHFRLRVRHRSGPVANYCLNHSESPP